MGLRLLFRSTAWAAAVALTANMALAQSAGANDDDDECKYITAKRGEGATVIPNEDLKAEDLEQFKYFLERGSGLLEPFEVDEEEEERCIAAIPAFEQAAAQAAAVQAAAVAPAAGVAPGTLAAGSIAGSLGVATLTGIAVFGLGIGVLAATNGGTSTGPVNTVTAPSVGAE